MNTLFEFLLVGSLYILILGLFLVLVRLFMIKIKSSTVTIYKLWVLFLVGFVLLLSFQQFEPKLELYQNIEQIIKLPTIITFSTFSTLNQNNIALWKSLIILVWAIVSVFLIFGLIVKYRKFKKSLIYSSNCLDNNTINSLHVLSPIAFGIINPQIFVPPDYQQVFTQSQQKLLMQHEQVHCHRKDPFVLMLYKLLTHLFWFHPVVYILNNYMKKDQEVSCDEIVLNKTNQSLEYSKLLLQLNQLTQKDNNIYCSSISMLKERIMLIKNLKPRSYINNFISKSILVISAIGLVLTTTALANIVKPDNTENIVTNAVTNALTTNLKPPPPASVPSSNILVVPKPLSPPKHSVAPLSESVQIVPTLMPPPLYPRQAAVDKTSGYVVVEFDILTDGTVESLNIVESKPEVIFNKEALKSVEKYIFKPISEKTRVRQRVEFKLGAEES